MLLSQMPGYSNPTIAIFPFRWHENGDLWMMEALRIQSDNSVKWGHYFVEDIEGHAKADVYFDFETAQSAASVFNERIQSKIEALNLTENIKASLFLKIEKEITCQQRLVQEEQLMFNEAMRRNKLIAPPSPESLILPTGREYLKEELYQQLCKAPKSRIVQLQRGRVSLVRSGDVDWSRIVNTNKTSGKYYFRDCIASAFGLSGRDHWGKTKAHIRSLLLPRANELLQLASVKKILADALAKGQRVVVSGGFVFWYEETSGIGWTVKQIGGESNSLKGETVWLEGTILSKNHGRIVVLPYIKENGEKVQGHTKNSAHDGKALPRHQDDYLEMPFEILNGDLMIGLFGELHYD